MPFNAQCAMLIGCDGAVGGSGRGGSGRTGEEEKEEGKVFSDGVPTSEAQAGVQMKERERCWQCWTSLLTEGHTWVGIISSSAIVLPAGWT